MSNPSIKKLLETQAQEVNGYSSNTVIDLIKKSLNI